MAAEAATPCANCQRLQAQVEALTATVAQLQATLAEVQEQLARARKDSSTSSKPPSSDIVKPPKPGAPADGTKRRQGGQPGHPKHERLAFPQEALTGGVHPHVLEVCPDCAGALRPCDLAPRVVQQVDVREVPLLIEEHKGLPSWCPRCQRVHYAPLPSAVE